MLDGERAARLMGNKAETYEDRKAKRNERERALGSKILALPEEKYGVIYADSQNVAAVFGKEHKNVLRDIRDLECSTGFRALNFELREEIQPHSTGASKSYFYEMTKDGFSFLTFGFTGPDAARWKEKYIEAFNTMEAKLRTPLTGPELMARALMDAAKTARRQGTGRDGVDRTQPSEAMRVGDAAPV
jgi:Rha family phage regulatory protein